MPFINIKDMNDPRLDSYRDLRNSRRMEAEGYFVLEGETIIRYASESGIEILSGLVADGKTAQAERVLNPAVPVYVISQEAFPDVAGYRFHRGVMAVARRRSMPSVRDVLESLRDQRMTQRLVVCPYLADPENTGTIIRLAAALGADGVLIGPAVPDPWSRRVVRVSMGAIWRMPVARFESMANVAEELKLAGIRLVGTSLHESATPLPGFKWPDKAAIIVGNEATGLDEGQRALCDDLVTLPMARGVDSLNAAVATGVFLYASLASR